MSRQYVTTTLLSLCALILLVEPISPISAEEHPHRRHAKGRRTLVSPHFVLHTDLPEDEARSTLERMERTIAYAAEYWRREPIGRIECYVADDVAAWPDSALPNPLVRLWIGGIGGATLGEDVFGRRQQQHKATVFAAARSGIPEHEVIHAYCCQTFGATGPEWYKEGMAELASFGLGPYGGVNCPPDVIRSLRQDKPRYVAEILKGDESIAKITESLSARLGNRGGAQSHLTLRDWTATDADNVRRARQSYFWSWSLCHFLVHNPNYAERFQALGDGFLTENGATFEETFADQAPELVFEFDQMMRHLSRGYRVDLCRWDWEKRSRPLADVPDASCQVLAARGYQASGFALVAGEYYAFHAEGEWRTTCDGPACDANGNPWGQGRLMGVMLDGYELGQPFVLGRGGVFQAPISGDLYLRCEDAWNQLGDNTGQVRLQLHRCDGPEQR